uniref:Uncharacterized protein n=1 Tax=Anopheles coluzzii TaxID=1518534 RepID=A0A8W7NZM1_ANOCL
MVVLDSGVSYWSMGIAGHMHGLGDHLVHGLSDLHSRGLTAHDGVESGVMISMVVDDALVTVGVQQRVLSVDFVSVASFVLALDVSGVLVMDGVRELVVGRSVVLYRLDDRGLSNGLDDSRGRVLVDSRGGVDRSDMLDSGSSMVLDGIVLPLHALDGDLFAGVLPLAKDNGTVQKFELGAVWSRPESLVGSRTRSEPSESLSHRSRRNRQSRLELSELS